MQRIPAFLILLTFAFLLRAQEAQPFVLPSSEQASYIVFSPTDPKLVEISANLLAEDIQRVTGTKPEVLSDLSKARGQVIAIGTVESPVVKQLAGERFSAAALQGQWETYAYHVVDKPLPEITRAFIVMGSDRRGAAFGVFNISEHLGISPWYWWADVPVRRQTSVRLPEPGPSSNPPSVKYRGIFLNDEDWGLQPWAAKTHEPETGTIGPKTYARIFELLLRLKANMIWPAMHDCTRAFYTVPGNKETADAYGIVIGTSHAEPMLRNNVGEWDHEKMGDFNFLTNRTQVLGYWRDRVREVSRFENIYTLGMRGIHDSPMVGASSLEERVAVLREIIERQRALLAGAKEGPLPPQAFVPYKEVLDVYEGGLNLPGEITLMWTDDNYGYVRRFSDTNEQRRSGRAGVYYHISYWGSPHDYLWLPSTHPMLLWQEMTKAYETGADRIWVVNVGDIKPLEYLTELFLDLAYDRSAFRAPAQVKAHLASWAEQNFGSAAAPAVVEVLLEYHRLVWERRPEFMGWGGVEPVTPNNTTAYAHFHHGDEAQQRLERFAQLERASNKIYTALPSGPRDAYFQLVHYAVVGASALNHRVLLAEKATVYAKQRRAVANDYARWAGEAQQTIQEQTELYNTGSGGGKWKHMMSAAPRGLPVFSSDPMPQWEFPKAASFAVMPESSADEHPAAGLFSQEPWYSGRRRLPVFHPWTKPSFFIDVFSGGAADVEWTATPAAEWIRLSQAKGLLSGRSGAKQQRIWVSIDWTKAPPTAAKSTIRFAGAGRQYDLHVNVAAAPAEISPAPGELAEHNGYVAFKARSYTAQRNEPASTWTVLEDLGYSAGAVATMPFAAATAGKVETIGSEAPYLDYTFFTYTTAPATVTVYALPSHPLNKGYGVRFAAAVDDDAPSVVDLKTEGRSPEWKRNVFSNSARGFFKTKSLAPGKHRLRLYRVDPGLVFDWITVDLGGLKRGYSIVPETRAK